MKTGTRNTTQCKDVPDAPVLRFLAGLNGRLAGWHDLQPRADYCPTVVDAMPPGTPEKVVLAKMRALVRRGLARGCCCGCRGDFRITPRGQEWLDAGRETPNARGQAGAEAAGRSDSPGPKC